MWINTTTGQIESEYAIRRNNPRSTYPTPMPESIPGYAWVVPEAQPAAQEWHTVVQSAPVFTGGQWTVPWQQVPMDDTQIIEEVRRVVQERLDNFAQTRGYDGILSLCSYATDPTPKFSAEGQYGVAKRGETWGTLYQIMADVQGGQRTMPTLSQVLSELPTLVWPV